MGSGLTLSGLTSRQLAFLTLKAVHQGAFADVALDRTLARHRLAGADRRLVTELVYGCVRRMRSLDALIDQFASKPAQQQPPDLRTALHLGLYQLRYLDQIPDSAAVNTTVDLLKENRMAGLSGFANGLLRNYVRRAVVGDPLALPEDPVARLGLCHSYPDWIVQQWLQVLGEAETEALCQMLNTVPTLDLRVNSLKMQREAVQAAFAAQHLETLPIPGLPQALRLCGQVGPITALPGYAEGWWTVQEASAQLVGHLLNPHPDATVIDLCAAPGGKTTHLVELMAGQGTIWACDRTASRLKRLRQNLRRSHLEHQVHLHLGDSCTLPAEMPLADFVLVDAPCSGLGTLHRHADARWRQTPETIQGLTVLQHNLLEAAAAQTKPRGVMVYATCTLNPAENEGQIAQFLAQHADWHLEPPAPEAIAAPFFADQPWATIWPQQQAMDGFFMARLRKT